jgi:hypothetical protein
MKLGGRLGRVTLHVALHDTEAKTVCSRHTPIDRTQSNCATDRDRGESR